MWQNAAALHDVTHNAERIKFRTGEDLDANQRERIQEQIGKLNDNAKNYSRRLTL